MMIPIYTLPFQNFQTCLLSSLKAKEGLCIITVLIVKGSALPAYFYEGIDEVSIHISILVMFFSKW